MVFGKQGHASSKTSRSTNFDGRQVLWEPASQPEGFGFRHMSAIKSELRPLVLEHIGIAINMTDGLIGDIACELGHGKVVVVRLERGDFLECSSSSSSSSKLY